MTNDEADYRYGSVNRRERLVTLSWSEIIGRYNTPDIMLDIVPRKWIKIGLMSGCQCMHIAGVLRDMKNDLELRFVRVGEVEKFVMPT